MTERNSKEKESDCQRESGERVTVLHATLILYLKRTSFQDGGISLYQLFFPRISIPPANSPFLFLFFKTRSRITVSFFDNVPPKKPSPCNNLIGMT